MTNHPNSEIDRRAGVHSTPLDGSLQPAAGHWRSIEAHAWLIVRSGHGLATEVTSLGSTQSGSVDVNAEVERSAVRLDLDLDQLVSACVECRTSRPELTTALTLESTHVGPVADHRWALAGRLSGPAGIALVESELEVRDLHRRNGHADEARFVVRTQVPLAALGVCATHVFRQAGTDHAELVTHLVATRDATT
jgi:hypothetical protein